VAFFGETQPARSWHVSAAFWVLAGAGLAYSSALEVEVVLQLTSTRLHGVTWPTVILFLVTALRKSSENENERRVLSVNH
jgi:hypothetical protein